MNQKQADALAAQGTAQQSACAHYWRVDAPNGPTSVGVCKHCGAIGEFRNSIPMGGWAREAAEARRAKAARARAAKAASS